MLELKFHVNIKKLSKKFQNNTIRINLTVQFNCKQEYIFNH